MILDKIQYYLEYNPVNGIWHYNSGSAPANTFNWFKISDFTDETLYWVFTELMDRKYRFKHQDSFHKHRNPSVNVIKKEWAYFLKMVELLDKNRAAMQSEN